QACDYRGYAHYDSPFHQFSFPAHSVPSISSNHRNMAERKMMYAPSRRRTPTANGNLPSSIICPTLASLTLIPFARMISQHSCSVIVDDIFSLLCVWFELE